MIYLGKDPVGIADLGPSKDIIVDSGELTLNQPTHSIVVTHNLNEIPMFGYIAAKLTDDTLMPYGCCVMCSYGRTFVPNAPNIDYSTRPFFIYMYKHGTSGNYLTGSYSAPLPTTTQFTFARGQYDWATVDTNGDPITYEWVVGTFK